MKVIKQVGEKVLRVQEVVTVAVVSWFCVERNHDKAMLYAGILVLVGVVLLSVHPAAAATDELSSFSQKIIDIATGTIAKALSVCAFLGAAYFLITNKIGPAITCAVGGILLAFAKTIANAIFSSAGATP